MRPSRTSRERAAGCAGSSVVMSALTKSDSMLCGSSRRATVLCKKEMEADMHQPPFVCVRVPGYALVLDDRAPTRNRPDYEEQDHATYERDKDAPQINTGGTIMAEYVE